ncbi:hypothetical protein LEL_07049 [Akanthomyces lecanii RCEF 1005]|uniref:Cell wall protein n=1 Tax=Akanthomyces lecanii RCEF 1005 TaxID=1081108 RepID=A0A168FE72_CORDF|nr:hypothetical protein LEL_07049 [Akanthomyces lecanii RCEF 1005]
MKLTHTILALPVVALAAPNLMDSSAGRSDITDALQLLNSGITKALACFDIALAKAGVRKPGAVVPQPPMGVDCDALIAMIIGGGGKATPSGTASSASSASSTSAMSSPSASSSSSSSSSSSASTSSASTTTGSSSSTSSMPTSSSSSSSMSTSSMSTSSMSTTGSSSASSATSSA